MRVFPLLDLQIAEFANQKARPGAGLQVQFCAAADASPSTPPTRPLRRSTTSALPGGDSDQQLEVDASAVMGRDE